MGAVVGCTKKICLEKNIHEADLELKDNNLENLNTINSNRNEITKPAFNEHERGNNININSIEEEEKENEEENEGEESDDEINEELNKYKNEIVKIKLIQKAYRNYKKNKNNNNNSNSINKSISKNSSNKSISKISSNKSLSKNSSNKSLSKNSSNKSISKNSSNKSPSQNSSNKSISKNSSNKSLSKNSSNISSNKNSSNISISNISNSNNNTKPNTNNIPFNLSNKKKTYSGVNRSNTKRIKGNNKDISKGNVKLERFHTMIAHANNNLKKNVHKYKCSVLNNEKIKNGKSKVDEEEQEIISVEQTYLPIIAKQSSKVINNFESIELLKSPLLQNKVEKPKENPNALKNPNSNQNYLRLLSDFGERRQSLFKSSGELSRAGSKIGLNTSSIKEKKEKSRKNHDDIKGNFTLKNEKVIRYQGGFVKKTKKKNGFGIVTWSDNSTLHGIYESSMINGIGRFFNHKYKSTFIGEYVNNIPKGFGVYQVKNLSLQGYWENNYLNGIAIEVWEDGTYYQGEYENNKKDGIGLYRWPDGTIYQGEFNKGQMTGKGIILYSDDCIFSGEMLNGFMNGYGIFSWGNGSLYMGYYLQDIKHGFGIYIWDSKMFICYIGFWEMGKQQGIGAKINGNKIKYCIWNKGKIATTLKGLYEIDRYLVGSQRGYYHFFTAGYIAKLRANSFYNFNPK